jgi:hypothetical protein
LKMLNKYDTFKAFIRVYKEQEEEKEEKKKE